MKVVLDTNVLLVSLSKKSIFRPIFEGFLNEKIILCVTTDILAEYEEILSKNLGAKIASNILQLIGNAQYLVSEDKHFNILKEVAFPKVELLKAREFLPLLKKDGQT